MTRLTQKNSFAAAKAAAFAIAAMISVNLHQAAAQRPPTPVEIVNTPVPVTGTVTGTITGSVTVTNTPSVNVANQVTVRDADNAGRRAVTIRFTTNQTSGGGFQFWQAGSIYTVPAGKRLVVENVDAEVTVTPNNNTGSVGVAVGIFDGTNTTNHPVGTVTNPVQCTLTQTCFDISTLSRFYADAGSVLSATLYGNLNASGSFHFARGSISGYLVDIP